MAICLFSGVGSESTLKIWIVPFGKSLNAPSRTYPASARLNGLISWLISTILILSMLLINFAFKELTE